MTGGLFGRVRNPIYSAMILAVIGMFLVAPNVVTIACPVLATIGAELLVRRVEEPHLSSVHGAAFVRYTSTTGRFFPAVGRRG